MRYGWEQSCAEQVTPAVTTGQPASGLPTGRLLRHSFQLVEAFSKSGRINVSIDLTRQRPRHPQAAPSGLGCAGRVENHPVGPEVGDEPLLGLQASMGTHEAGVQLNPGGVGEQDISAWRRMVAWMEA